MKKVVNTILLAFVLSFFSSYAYSQIRVGVRAGMNSSKTTGSRFDAYTDNGYENQSRTGYNAGIYLDIPVIQNFSIQPGLFLTSKGNKLMYEKSTTRETTQLDLSTYKRYDVKETTYNSSEEKREQTYLQIPILFAYRYQLPLNLFVQAGMGPYFAYGLYGEIESVTTNKKTLIPDKYGQNKTTTKEDSIPTFGESDDDQQRGHYSRFDAGISLLAAVGWKRVHIALGYDIGLKNSFIVPDLKGVPEKEKNKIESMDLKTRNLSITLGFEF